MLKKKTLVLGASENPYRYSNRAITSLLKHGHPVIAIGKKEGDVEGCTIINTKPTIADLDTVTLYLNPTIQKGYYDYITTLKPKRIIFNPGTENTELKELAAQNGIETIEACTLVMLSTKLY